MELIALAVCVVCLLALASVSRWSALAGGKVWATWLVCAGWSMLMTAFVLGLVVAREFT